MADLRDELEQITAQFVSSVLAAARSVPLQELAAVATAGRRSATSNAHAPSRSQVRAASPSLLPRGVRGAPTALKRAVEWQRQLDSGQVRSRAEIARREGLTRARVTQIMNLLGKKR
jgi:hypothetical protein